MAQKGYRQRQNRKKESNHDVLGITLVVISLFLLLCIVIPPILSIVSRSIFNILLGVFGIMSYPLLIGLFLIGSCLLLKKNIYMTKKYVICTVLITLFALVILQLASTHAFLRNRLSDYISAVYAAKYSVGGVVYGVIAFGLKTALTEVGCYVIFSIALLITVAVMTDLIARVRSRKKTVAPAPVKQQPRGFTSPSEPQLVVPVEPQNKLYIGQIARKTPIVTETGNASDLPPRDSRRVSDYAPSPVIEKGEKELKYTAGDSPSAARYALYGDSDAINEQATEEFTNRPEPGAAPANTAPARAESPVEPYMRVSADAKASVAANRPRMIEHDDLPDMQVFFPAPKKFDFNDDNIISTDEDIKARLTADTKKRKQSDIENLENANVRERRAPFVIPDFNEPAVRDLPPIESVDDIFAPPAPPAFSPEPPREDIFDPDAQRASEKASIADSFFTPPKQEEKQDDIIDAFVMRDMYNDVPADSRSKLNERPDDIIDADNGGIFDARPKASPPVSPIITGGESFRSEPAPKQVIRDERDDGIVDALVISDGPAIDLSETRDNTSDIIDGGESSGMYVPADEFEGVQEPAAKPRAKKNAPLDNQITIAAVLQAQADESVIMTSSTHRKKYDYSPPPIDLLKTYNKAEASADDLQRTAETLERVVGGFLKAEVKVINIVPGPTVTRYELEVPSGISVKQIEARAQDIEYELATVSHIRIEAPIPGKRAVGIEVPNTHKSIVGLRDVIESHEFESAKSAMTVSVGKDISGEVVLCNLVKVPHLLIAGQTGSGKSACLNGLIISLLYKSSPEDLRFILVDPKRVEFSAYRGMPHLLFDNIVYEPSEVLSALKWACIEMERRYALMAKYGRNQLATFNELPDVQSGKIDKLPHIIIIIDELADIMQSVVKRDIEDRIKVIAAKARAAGIHLIVATQRPSADVLTGTIKTNLTSRIAFKVSTQIDSRIILDMQGAEALVGNGDMLFFPVEYSAPRRVQGSYISDEEVGSVITYIKEHFECDFDEDAARAVFSSGGSGGSGGSSDGGKEDSLLPDVLALVIKTGQASTSGIQRRFSIGYARAARIIDSMEDMGFIGPNTGNSKPRDVLITAEKYRELYGRDVDDN